MNRFFSLLKQPGFVFWHLFHWKVWKTMRQEAHYTIVLMGFLFLVFSRFGHACWVSSCLWDYDFPCSFDFPCLKGRLLWIVFHKRKRNSNVRFSIICAGCKFSLFKHFASCPIFQTLKRIYLIQSNVRRALSLWKTLVETKKTIVSCSGLNLDLR